MKRRFRQRFYYYNKRYERSTRVKSQSDANRTIERDPRTIVVIERDDGTAKSVVFQCPDGCGEVLRINVAHTLGSRSWRFRADVRGRVSLYPSVWRTTGCHAHFFLTLNTARGYENMPPPKSRTR
jgi:hypothetical protein